MSKTYYLAPRWRIPFLCLAIGGVGVTLWVLISRILANLQNIGQLGSSFLLTAIIFCLAAELVYEVLFSRLVISPAGIDYHQPRYRLQATWADIEGVTYSWGSKCLVLRKPAVQTNKVILRFFLVFGPWDKLIPISPYMDKSTNSELSQVILSQAPHLKDLLQ